MYENAQKIDLWDPEAEMVKFIGEKGKICLYQSEDKKRHKKNSKNRFKEKIVSFLSVV